MRRLHPGRLGTSVPALVLLSMATASSAGPRGEAQVAVHQPHGTVVAARAGRPPAVDGRLSEELWELATPAGDFSQTDPDEGQPATESTEVRVLFDDDAIYVGIRLYDGDPDAVVRRLAKRDEDPDGDRVTVYLDPMHDHLTGAFFRVSASGVQKDAAVFNDTWDDPSWDAVWQSAVGIDDAGWSVEIRIPLSQLRFQQADRGVWGINVARYVQRKNETTWLERVPKSQNGLASRMAHLVGLDGIARHRRLQLLPYAAARAEFIGGPHTASPFNDGARQFGAGGIDMKWGISSSITLDGTMNPDFGQVEVDPAVVNLTAFEVFFEERRPFFLEGAQIFQNFGRSGANNYWGFNSSDPSLFYSRRIGRAPQLRASGDFVDAPSGTTIVAAAKVTGKTRSGWSIGLLDAITDTELARTSSRGMLDRTVVEPRTNYSVLRLQRDIGRRAGIGMIATAVSRQLETTHLASLLPTQAIVGGADGYWFLGRGRDWVVNGRLAVSRISGSAEAIARAQALVQRAFQRPDATHVSYDPSRSALTGFTGRANLNRNSGLWQVNASLWGVSPGFESNDLGFLTTGDRAGAHVVVLRRTVIPDRFSRSRALWLAKWWTWNFDRERQGDGVQANAFVTLHNWWTVSAGGSLRRRVFDDRLTRGGVSAVAPGGGGWTLNMSTDARRPVSFQVNTNGRWDESGAWNRVLGTTVSLKPLPQLVFTLGPQLTRAYTTAQYIRSVPDSTATATFGRRELFGLLEQTQFSMTVRASVVVTPRLSLQVFAQPLLSAGRYAGFRELAGPRTFDFVDYAGAVAPLTYEPATRAYQVDPDGAGPAVPFTFADPAFNLKSLRVNSVFRWDLRPGSAFYAVWTRTQQDDTRPGSFALGRDLGTLLSAPGDDVVMVKIACWLGG